MGTNAKNAKLTAFEPSRDKNGNHKSFEGGYGTLWKFIVAFDNGDKGEASSSKQTPLWTIGDEFTYSLHVVGIFCNIRGMTPTQTQKTTWKPKTKTKEEWQFFCAQRLMRLLCESRKMTDTEALREQIKNHVETITRCTEEGVDEDIWLLSLNSVECLLQQDRQISIDDIDALNKICLTFRK